MPNDTSISRVSAPDSTATLNRKKSNSDSIDVSKLSFFDELLSISQFASTIPEAPAAQPASDSKSDKDSTSEQVADSSNDNSDESKTESDAANTTDAAPAFAQQQLVVQPAVHSAKPERQKDKPEHPDAIQGTKKQRQSQQAAKHDSSDKSQNINSQESDNTNVTIADNSNLQNTQVLNSQVDSASSKDESSQSIVLDSQAADDEIQTTVATTDEAIKTKPIPKARSSAKASDDDAEDANSGQDISLLTPVRNDSNREKVGTPREIKPIIEQVDNADEGERSAVDVEHPRNRRSVRLAEQASGDHSASDERDSSSESSQLFESQAAATSADTTKEQSIASAPTLSSSLPSVPAITPSFTPTIPISNTFSNTSTNPSSNTRSAIEGVAAVTTSTTNSVTQTGTTNTTISGTTPTSSASDSGRSEVARSNSGTQITAYQEGKLVQRVLRGVEQLANGGGQVRLRLHPAELGSLQISLKVEAGQVSAKLEVENATARDALLNNVQALKDRLAEQGIKIGSFEVEVGADSTGSGTSSSNFQSDGGSSGQSYRDNATSRFAQQNSNRLPIDAVPSERTPPAAWTRNGGSLDLTV